MNTNELLLSLRQFTGTEMCYRITPSHILTDGTKYLAEEARCIWLMYAIASHLHRIISDTFCLAKLSVNDTRAVLTLDDGNGNVYASQ